MKPKVLVIEDNEQNRYLVTFILEQRGYQVIQARHGREGVELARQIELRRNQALAGVPIVAVTSYAMPGDRERILGAGCVGYIEKPIDPETFVADVEAYLPGGGEP
jgi:two-component system cell cycle response regulator DivK